MFTIIYTAFFTIVLVFLYFCSRYNPSRRTTLYCMAAAIIFLQALFVLSCFNRVRPGEIGVVVNMLGNSKGVEEHEKTVGIHWIAPWKEMYLFPTYEQNHQWTGDEGFTFQTSEGLPVKADIGITYHLEPTRIHNLFARYRRGMDEITHLFIRNNIRNFINRYSSKMKIEDLMGDKKEEFFQAVQQSVQKELTEMGFIITHIYTIGQFNVPDTVKSALNAKIVATQKAQERENELREAEAQARKIVAQSRGDAESRMINAEAQAKSNDIVAKSLTPELIRWNALQKWDGKLPHVVGGKDMPFIINVEDK